MELPQELWSETTHTEAESVVALVLFLFLLIRYGILHLLKFLSAPQHRFDLILTVVDRLHMEASFISIGMSLDANQAHWNSAIEGLGCVVPTQKNYHIAKPFDPT